MVRQRGVILNYQRLFQRKLNLFQIKVLVLRIHVNCCLIYEKNHSSVSSNIQVLVALRHSFCIFLFLFTLHTFIQSFINNIRLGQSPYLHSCELSRLNLHAVRSPDSNSGLPYSKSAHLSYAAPFKNTYTVYMRWGEREIERRVVEREKML